MKKLDAAIAKKIAPSALMVLIAGPIFLFFVMDLIMFAAMAGSALALRFLALAPEPPAAQP